MNIKENPWVQSNENSNKRSTHRLYNKKQFKIQLHKITYSFLLQLIGKKTIEQLIQNLQKFTKNSRNEAYPLLCQCLKVLKGYRFQKKDNIISKTQQTEIIQKKNEGQTNEQFQNITKSQVFNIQKCNIRRMQSKELIDKVACMKYMNGNLSNNTDKQVISKLMGKLKEKEKMIRQLQRQIDDLNKSVNKQKACIAAQAYSNQLIIHQKESLFKENLVKTYRINQLQQRLARISEEEKEKVQTNILLEGRCTFLQKQSKQRKQQGSQLSKVVQNFDFPCL